VNNDFQKIVKIFQVAEKQGEISLPPENAPGIRRAMPDFPAPGAEKPTCAALHIWLTPHYASRARL
ncbi:hypothetical protein, partial [Ensifer aridi]|uniref:hypothetical protein n=1 Tax=Ensifer aridi TaxID=1708715 RepID=UPI001AECE5EE